MERSLNYALAALFVAGPLTLVAMWFLVDDFDGGHWFVALIGFTAAMAALSLVTVAMESWERAALLLALAAGVGVVFAAAAVSFEDFDRGIVLLVAVNLAAGLLVGRWWFLVFAALSFPLFLISFATMPVAAVGVGIAKHLAYRDRQRERA
jgi:hypothetical protein